tara:strand:- start:1772 stop:2053 length:282 start_codon:yes stop_codon:yes gene_type:complete
MVKRIKRKKKTSRKIRPMPIYTSPDGGETVYEQIGNGERRLIEQTQKAKDQQEAYEELEMVGVEAIELRRKHPTLKKAWDQYRTVWHLIQEND